MKNFTELTERLKGTPSDQLRKESEGYLEMVLLSDQLKSMSPILEEYFGPPFKPAGVATSKLADSYTADYGGIEIQQTLYYFEKEGVSSCAMIWPWQDKTRVTLKIAEGVLESR